jgi:hypothetical protein
MRRLAGGGCGQRHFRHRCENQKHERKPTAEITQIMLSVENIRVRPRERRAAMLRW